jgi:thiol-disulfide isomerase/thioredoxin
MGLRLRTPIRPIEPARGWLNGEPIDVTRSGAAATLIHFWGLSCPLCKEQMPTVRRWIEQFGPRGLRVVGVHTPLVRDDQDEVKVERMVQTLDLHHPIALDQEGAVAAAYKVDAVPTYFVFDRNRLLRYRHTGYQSERPIERMIERLLSEAERETIQNRPAA